jgi:hypothetical protein
MYLDPSDPRWKAYAASQGRDPIAQLLHDSLAWEIPAQGFVLWLGTTQTAWRRLVTMAGETADAAAFERWLAGRFPTIEPAARRLAA